MTPRKQRYNRKPGSFDRFTSAQINGEGKKLLDQEPLEKQAVNRLDRFACDVTEEDRKLLRKQRQQRQDLYLRYQALLREGVEKGTLLPD